MEEPSSCQRDLFARLITDPGKKSKAGRLALVDTNGKYETIGINKVMNQSNLLEPVFLNGKLIKECTFKQVREQQIESCLEAA